MFCNQCGQANSTDAKFCSKCGNKLENTKTQSTNKPQSSKKLSTLRRIWLIFLFVLSLCMILGVFPYQLISGDFELKYILALLLWGAVFQYTWAQIFPKKSWLSFLFSKSESEPPSIQAIQAIQPPAQTKTPQSKIRPTLWNPTAAANWSFLFSPAFGAYIHMLNWQKLGFGEKAKSSRNWFFVNLLLSLLGLGLLVLIAWYFSSAKEQIKYIKTHFGDNYPKNSWGKPLLIGFGTVLVVIILMLLIPDLNKHTEKQNNQSPQFNQFDDTIKGNQQESQDDPAVDRDPWLEQVKEIQNKINNNQIPLIESIVVNKPVDHLSNELGRMLESNQTWWKSNQSNGRRIYIHFINKSEFPIHGLVLNSFQNFCGQSSNKYEFIIESTHAIQPFSEVVLSFLAPKYLNNADDQCLNIVSTWY